MHCRRLNILCSAAATFFAVSSSLAFPSSTSKLQINNEIASYHVLTQESDISTNLASRLTGDFTFESDQGLYLVPGDPILPATTRMVEIEPGTRLKVSVSTNIVGKIRATEQIQTYSEEHDTFVPFQSDNERRFIPDHNFMVGEPLSFRGRTFVPVTVYPVQYDAVNKEYIYNLDVEVQIQGKLIQENSRATNGKISFASQVADYVTGRIPNRDDIPVAYPSGKYVIAAREECIPSAIPLIEWKRQAGFEVTVLAYPVNVSAVEIKQEIQDIWDAMVAAGEEPFDYLFLMGDKESHEGRSPLVLPSFVGRPTMQGIAPHADYLFGMLDQPGDSMMDVAVGRMSSGSVDRMALAVNRQLAYEKNPNMDHPEWFTSTGVFAQKWGEVAIEDELFYGVRWGKAVLQRLGYQDIRQYEDFVDDSNGQRVARGLAPWLNEGINIWIGRAQIYGWEHGLAGVEFQENNLFPFGINVCGHGEFTAEYLYNDGDGDHLRGPVVWTFAWGTPLTVYSNGIWQSMVTGVLLNDLPVGWARTKTLLDWPVRFPNGSPMRHLHMTDFDLYGDPGLQPWTKVPTEVSVDYPYGLRVNDNNVLVRVWRRDEDAPLKNATVTLYIPGDLPDPEEYPEFSPVFQMSTKTDETGFAKFLIPEGLPAGRLIVTISGRNICPAWEEIDLQPADAPHLVIETSDIINGSPTAGSQCTLRLTVRNDGQADAEEVSGRLISASRQVEVNNGAMEFGDIAAGESSVGNNNPVVTFAPSTPDGFVPELILLILPIQGDTFRSVVRLNVLAPKLEASGWRAEYQIGREISLVPRLDNVGGAVFEGGSAELISHDWRVEVIDGTANYGQIATGEGSLPINNNGFVLRTRPGSIIGTVTDIEMRISSNNQLLTTLPITIELIDTISGGGPEPADTYGYTCFDVSDTSWVRFPTGAWFEISPHDGNYNEEGSRVPIGGDQQAKYDTSCVIPIDFPFTFYGETFDSITVCTNGFISAGSQPEQVNFENNRMELASGGSMGMIAPFWDELTLQVGDGRANGIFYFYDEGKHRFIIEWYESHFKGDRQLRIPLTFQVQILDARYYPTVTGDCPIVFHYKNITNFRDITSFTSFASVGVSSPDGHTGLGVNFDSTGTAFTPLVQSGMKLLFATTPIEDNTETGSIHGRVRENNGAPWANETIRVSAFGFASPWTTETDDEGNYRIDKIAPGRYTLEIGRDGYNPIRRVITVESGVDQVQDAVVTHPDVSFRFPVQYDSLRTPPPNFTVRRGLYMRNRGDGPLNYSTYTENDTGGYLNWFRIESNASGTIEPGELKTMIAVLNTFQLRQGVDTTYHGFLYVVDSIAVVTIELPLSLNVDSENGMIDDEESAPQHWSLSECYPNPFNATTRIRYSVPAKGNVKLVMFDTQGRQVRTILDQSSEVGTYDMSINCEALSPGIYLIKIDAEGFSETRKMILLK